MERISNTIEAKAKAILLGLCAHDQSLASHAAQLLDRIEARERCNTMTTSNNQQGTKRKALPLKICVQCQDAFCEEENHNKACRYHDGAIFLQPIKNNSTRSQENLT
ncbi:hypothetical protein F4808DRAFT_412654 [Astrocystis sublimbata]|nr:hypothetical protein F4808DRAFT_412654 [Astrocystis sublimbata]